MRQVTLLEINPGTDKKSYFVVVAIDREMHRFLITVKDDWTVWCINGDLAYSRLFSYTALYSKILLLVSSFHAGLPVALPAPIGELQGAGVP